NPSHTLFISLLVSVPITTTPPPPPTTMPDQAAAKAPDLIGRDFTATEVNTKYVGDITYLPLDGGQFCYLATVIDLASRRLGDRRSHANRTRHRRAHRRPVDPGSLTGAIMHTDHGSQYKSRAFAEACRSAGVVQSMGSIGSSADNALAESFNASFKRETLQDRKTWSSEREARLDAFRWLHRNNTQRRHSRLGHRNPIAYETALRTTSTTLAQAA
ncbi:DDE-type integrase/transposase/recombinase, partial [Streptomyces sp. NPDC059442]|uniref:DDE-type integrase/transposase/recombinase n=1 Tax=Streptomyces sp. NPDC059442 TaxID=3346830 RepID=UPI0036B15FAC